MARRSPHQHMMPKGEMSHPRHGGLASDNVADWMQALLQSLLQVDPAQRPTAAAVCRHPWALDLPESPCDTTDGSDCYSPHQQMMPQEELSFGGHESEDRSAEEQRAVECTAQAMQQLWLQQEALMNGASFAEACRYTHSISIAPRSS